MQKKARLPLRSVSALFSHLLRPWSCGQGCHSSFILMHTELWSCLQRGLPVTAINFSFPQFSVFTLPCHLPLWPLQSYFPLPSPRKRLLTAQCGHKHRYSERQSLPCSSLSSEETPAPSQCASHGHQSHMKTAPWTMEPQVATHRYRLYFSTVR